MNALLIRPGEKIEETDVEFTKEFLNEFFGEVETGAYVLGYLNLCVYFITNPTSKPANFTLFDIPFFGNVLITGIKPNGEPCSLAYEDGAFIRRYINACKQQVKAPKKRGCKI